MSDLGSSQRSTGSKPDPSTSVRPSGLGLVGRIVVAIALVALFVAWQTWSDRVQLLGPGTYADVFAGSQTLHKQAPPHVLSFQNMGAPDSRGDQGATPDSQTVYMVGGTKAQWGSFFDAWTDSGVATVTVGAAGRLVSIDVRTGIGAGDVVRPHRVE